MENYLERHWQTSRPELRDTLDELLVLTGGAESANASLYREMLWSLVRLIQEDIDRWDAKITSHALRELQSAFTHLRQYRRRRKVTMFGSSRIIANAAECQLAEDLGRLLAQDGFMVITGAGGGIMHAAHRGAGQEHSLGFHITLPFEQTVNPVVAESSNLLEFRFFFTRKLFLAKEADALVIFPGGFGTLDETFEVLTLVQTGKSRLIPILFLDVPGGTYWHHWRQFVETELLHRGYISRHDLALVEQLQTARDAFQRICHFYRNFHSSRRVDGELRIRMLRALPPEALERLNEEFKDISSHDGFSLVAAHPDEHDEPEIRDFPRLAFRFDGGDYGRLRQLIDCINEY
ncbi:MAG: TIGR00730 family Rossman fold protein [Gammaproteobacteria bacterium]